MTENAPRQPDSQASQGKVRNLGPAAEGAMGKVPPQALDMEEAVLGALLLEKDALHRVIDSLAPEMFYKTAHQHIYEAIQTLFQRSEPVDILSVKDFLRKAEKLDVIGGAYYLAQLTSNVASSANIEYHARVVAEKFLLRKLITMCGDTMEKAYDPSSDAIELLDRAEQSIFEVSESHLRRNYEGMDSLVMRTLERLEEMRGKDSSVTGIPSGFAELDAMTAGWQKTDMVIIAARPAMGKCLGKGTRVLMYDGSLKAVEDVCTGDLLMGPDSQPRRVKSIATGEERMYWVRQNNAIDYRVNESHLLSLKRSRREGGHQKGAVLNISVKDYLEKSAKFQSNYKGYKVAVDFEEKPLPIDPYFLGIWLGDGRKDDIRIANQDEEVISFLRDDAANLDMKLSTYEHPKKVAMHAIVAGPIGHKGDSLQAQLRALDLLNHKHIPRTYLINSRSQRLQLLAGLIDSDGHYYKKHNGYEISQKDEALARQIKFLCDTLGFRTSLRKKKAGIAAIGYESEAWRVRFSGSIEEIPVRIPRKQGKPYTKNRDWRVTGIQVEYDKVDTYYGFELEGPDGLFCLEDLTVTHNTALTLTLARNAALRFNTPVALFSLEMAGVQLTQRLLTGEAELDAQKVRTGRLEDYEWKQLITRIGGLSKAPIYIDDTPGLSITDLRAKARRLKAEKDIGMLIIDYLQLMSGNVSKGGNREQEIAGISRSLKIIAKELDVCVIALSQLSRAVESRGGDKRPVLSDLRESGCLTGDTLVLDAQTGARIPIKELAERPWKEEMKTPGVDAGWKVGEQQMVKAFYSGKKKVFELETWSGRKIKASANHPFLKLNGWTRLDQLNAGDAIAIPRKLSFSQPSNPMKTEELILLAHLLGDGCILPRQPYHYTSNDEANLQVVAETAKQLFGIEPRKVAQKNWWHLYLPSPYHLTHGKKHPITDWYEQLGLERVRAKDKQLPDALFRCDEERVGLFLHHLWATDGNLSWKKLPGRKDAGAIYYASTSEKLVEQVQHLLLRLGIVASIRKSIKKAYKASFQVHIQGAEDQLLFLEKVGCFGRRGEIADALKASLDQVHPNPNSGTIPADAWRTVIQQEKERIGISWREFAKRLGTSYGGTTLFKRGISRQRMARIAQALEGSEKIQNLAESHVYWDTIKQITPLGIEDVYDATVLDVHNFVANDIIVHNSIEQDADMVAFLYRPEYYGFETDEEGNSTQGLAELIIAKQRNGPTGTVKLQFIGKYGKFSDWGYNTNSDIESAYGQLGGTPAGAGGNTITLPSKLNEDPAQGGQGNDMDVPF